MKTTSNYFGKKLITYGHLLILKNPNYLKKRRVPTRFEDGTAEETFFHDCETYFHSIYYEAMNLIINCIKERFDQP